MNLKENLINNLKYGETKFVEEIEKNKSLTYEKRNMENIEIVSVYYETEYDSEFIEEFEFDENENYVGNYKTEGLKRREFILYEQLTPEQRIHLSDFQIINSIENATDKEFTIEEKNRLFVIIDYTISEHQGQESIASISDEIVQAYAENKIDLDALENLKATEILDCAIGLGSFKEHQYEEEDLEE